ncbi:acyltransferase [Colwellia sp. BRX8-6]|uniref:acyltransferase family protein n=1 Tax=Colwellia sp. BRX8-6 TaxID=2759834 RepID=UPI0015F6E48A|nr:acyltransferase [Colwellia sp. BRX8-6]MBA6361628.1 acyltransferase [Colwellia sp. BRX8-6]
MLYKLESLRGVAACLVVLIHSAYNFGVEPILFVSNSYLFVDFFFILSGFLMCYAYEDKIHSGFKFYTYIALRLGRIYPLHIFVLLLWIPYILIRQYLYQTGFGGVEQLDKNNIYTFISNIFLVQSLGLHNSLSWNFPSWSISTEFFAYICFFILTVTLDKAKKIYVPLIIIAGCYVFLQQLNRSGLDITYDFGSIRCIGAFYIGVLSFRIKQNVRSTNLTISCVNILEIMVLIAIIVGVTMAEQHYGYLYFSLFSFACAILIFSNQKNGVLGQFLSFKLMRNIGMWSYSIYLLHSIILGGITNILEYVFNIDPNIPQGIIAIIINSSVLIITIILSKYSYQLIEKKYRDIIKLKVWKTTHSHN